MMAGLASSCPAGYPEDIMLVFERQEFGDGTGCLLRFRLASGYGNSFWIVVCDGKIVGVFYIKEGQLFEVTVIYDPLQPADANGLIEHPISLVPNGGWSDASFVDAAIQQQVYMLDKAK